MIIQNSFIVILGNSFSIKDTLKKYGFKFDGQFKVWFKLASKESFKTWEKEISNKDVSVAYTESLENVPKLISLHKEAQSIENELNVQSNTIITEISDKILEMSKWYANKFKEQHNTKFAFRNMKILNVYKETEKAYLVDAEFFGGIATSCGCCGKSLSNDISIATGIGPICASKLGFPRIDDINQAHIIVEEMHKMSKECGIFKQVWIPKSQIKKII